MSPESFDLATEFTEDGMVYTHGDFVLEASKQLTRWRITVRVAEVILGVNVVNPADEKSRRAFLNSLRGLRQGDNEVLHRLLIALAVRLNEDWRNRDQLLRERSKAVEADHVPYLATDDGLFLNHFTQAGPVEVPLTNFRVEIVADVVEDDGSGELQRALELEAKVGERTQRLAIPSSEFAAMNWPIKHLGAKAIVFPGQNVREHTRVAVQMLSGEIEERRVYTHTGWRHIDDCWVFLHAGGAIGPDGPVDRFHTHMQGSLANFVLPAPPDGDELKTVIRADLDLLELAPLAVTVPLLAGAYRAALGPVDSSLHLAGPTGVGKSELAALVQQHFGPGMDARHLPGSWSSTGNALEGLGFLAKDVVLVVDDFAPNGTPMDVQRMHREAERVFRAQGNALGRQRMRADASLRTSRPPRGLILSTGEDVPRGQSLQARLLTLELGPNDIDWDRLTTAQRAAAAGTYARSMSGYLRWAAGNYAGIEKRLLSEVAELREEATRTSSAHRRTPVITANLALGWRYFLRFAVEAGAITQTEHDDYWQRGWSALGEAAAAQAHHQRSSEPVQLYLELLASAIASGRAHVADPRGREPEEPEPWGWRERTIGTGDNVRDEWQPQGSRIGWLDGEDLYLDPGAAFAAAQDLGRQIGNPLSVQQSTLSKRLRQRGLLRSTEAGDRDTTVRKTLEGRRARVLHLPPDSLKNPGQPGQPVHQQAVTSPNESCSGPVMWPGSRQAWTKPGHEAGPHEHVSDEFGPDGPDGPVSDGCVHQSALDVAARWGRAEQNGAKPTLCQCCFGPTINFKDFLCRQCEEDVVEVRI